MSYSSNMFIIIIILIFIVSVFVIFFIFNKDKFKSSNKKEKHYYTVENMHEVVKNKMNEIVHENLYSLNLSRDEFDKRRNQIDELASALESCNTGDISSKIYVREFIKDILVNVMSVNNENINIAIPFDEHLNLSSREKFEIIMQRLISEHYGSALSFMIEKYGLNKDRDKDSPININSKDIDMIYDDLIGLEVIPFNEKMNVLSQIIYSHYKGFGVIDEIRDMSIDGVMGGVSGNSNKIIGYMSDIDMLKLSMSRGKSGMNSVWILYKATKIHMSFLSFESESEIIRIITNFDKYRRTGQISEAVPYIISDMYDESRITLFRPSLTESWAFFNRKKYSEEALDLENLYTQINNDLLIKLMIFLIKADRSMIITGGQGSGKTTLLIALIKYIKKNYTIRIQESDFELNLRSIYPKLNTLAFQETPTVTGQKSLDLTKKSDSDVTILGEIATDEVAAWAIQISQVASEMSLSTHHANTFDNLVENMVGALIKTETTHDESRAEIEVVNAIDFNIHMSRYRFPERITESILLDIANDRDDISEKLSKANTVEDKMSLFMEMGIRFFDSKMKKKLYTSHNILEFEDGRFVAKNRPTKKMMNLMKQNMEEKDYHEFEEFLNENWGA